MDLQDKQSWCIKGEEQEHDFINKFGKELNLSINPDKKFSPYVPDFLYNNIHLADLKTQNTPFFMAKKKYGIDPTYAVVFNRKDAHRYFKLYPDIMIYFHVDWKQLSYSLGGFTQTVENPNSIYMIHFKDLFELLKVAPEHFYRQRANDGLGNAKSSFLLDIRHPKFKKVK